MASIKDSLSNLGGFKQPIVVFLGPSYDRFLAQKLLNADYRPPAKRGDIAHAAKEGAKTIVLIDGYLVYEYPPSPMEVYKVITQGVKVIGSASLGALRAVELKKYGMIGSGWVYQRYLDLSIDSDDEVVTSLDIQTDKGLTLPLVRIRFAVSQLISDNRISKSQGDMLVSNLQNIYFERRTKESVYLAGKKCSMSDEIIKYILSKKFDVKAIDTLDCLRHIALLFEEDLTTLGVSTHND